YQALLQLAETKDHEAVYMTVRQYGIASGKLWTRLRQDMPSDLCDN
ncbi:MAG: fatty acid metabolism transcriptional regulator FadR, partial [Aeromonas sp.]